MPEDVQQYLNQAHNRPDPHHARNGHDRNLVSMLMQRIEDLERRLGAVINRVADHDMFAGSLPGVFLAEKTASQLQFKELSVVNGLLADFTGSPRIISSDSDPGALIQLGANQFICVVVRDGNGRHMRYVPVSGSATLPVGQYQFMNYCMVSQNAAGFDFVRASPPII